MSNIHHEDFEELLNIIRERLSDFIEFGEITSIESNFDTKSLVFKKSNSIDSDGTIIVGEDNGFIAVDISKADGEVVSFVLKDLKDGEGIDFIVNWFIKRYGTTHKKTKTYQVLN